MIDEEKNGKCREHESYVKINKAINELKQILEEKKITIKYKYEPYYGGCDEYYVFVIDGEEDWLSLQDRLKES